jgi:hypothetical protein
MSFWHLPDAHVCALCRFLLLPGNRVVLRVFSVVHHQLLCAFFLELLLAWRSSLLITSNSHYGQAPQSTKVEERECHLFGPAATVSCLIE